MAVMSEMAKKEQTILSIHLKKIKKFLELKQYFLRTNILNLIICDFLSQLTKLNTLKMYTDMYYT